MNRCLTLLAVAALLVQMATAAAAVRSAPDQKRDRTQLAKRADARTASPVRRAVAVLVPVGESDVFGTVHFTKKGNEVRVRGVVRGLEPGKHGFHVHQYGDLTDLKQGKSAGGHYNPTHQPHGRRTDQERHVGDLGNIEANEEGVARFDFTDRVIDLGGPHSVVGRALVVHESADQFTQPSGDAGDRVAIGVIGIARRDEKQ